VTGEPELLFAEYMVQGKMNLYCVAYSQNEYFFFEREDGEMALFSNKTLSSTSTFNALENQKALKQEKQEQYGKVKLLLKDSGTAVVDMDDEYITRKKLVNVVRDYHNDVCTDGSKCVVYEYNDKNDKGTVHFKAFAGFAYYAKEKTAYQIYEDTNYKGSAFEIGLGMEFDFERVAKGFSAEFNVAFTPKYRSTQNFELDRNRTIKSIYEKKIFTFSLGAVKRFGSGKIQPLVRGGFFAVLHSGLKETNQLNNYSAHPVDWTNCYSNHYGLYVGAGAQMPVGSHSLRLHADLYKSIESKSADMTKLGITAEFVF
jgi:hypothetical protein